MKFRLGGGKWSKAAENWAAAKGLKLCRHRAGVQILTAAHRRGQTVQGYGQKITLSPISRFNANKP